MNDFEARMTAINRHITTPQDLRERVNESLGAIRTEAAAALPQQPRRRARRLRLAAAGVAALAALAIGLGLAFAPTQVPTGPAAAFFFSAYATQQSGQQNTVTLQPSLHDAILTEDGCYSGTLFTVQGDGIEGVSVFLEGQGELYRQTPLPDGWTPETQEEGPALSWTVSEDLQRLSERLGQSLTVRYDSQAAYGFFGAYTAADGLTATEAARHSLLDLDGALLGITVQYAPTPGEDQETRTSPVIESRYYRLESDGETLTAVFQQGRTWDEDAEDDFDATAGGWAQEGDFSFVERNEAVGGGGKYGLYVASSFSIAGDGIERIELETTGGELFRTTREDYPGRYEDLQDRILAEHPFADRGNVPPNGSPIATVESTDGLLSVYTSTRMGASVAEPYDPAATWGIFLPAPEGLTYYGAPEVYETLSPDELQAYEREYDDALWQPLEGARLTITAHFADGHESTQTFDLIVMHESSNSLYFLRAS